MTSFHFTLPSSPAPAAPGTDENGHITDHADRAVNRLAQQYRLPKLEAFLRALIHPLQAIEDVAWQLYTERFIDTAIGAQLDLIGRIVGQPRLGYLDDDYRRLCRARIIVNRSNGNIPDLLTVVTAVVNDPAAVIIVEPQYPGCIVFRINNVAVTAAVADLVIALLRKAASGGVRVIFESTEHTEATTFSFFEDPTGVGFGDDGDASAGGFFASGEE